MASYGVGASLAGLGLDQKHQALGVLRSAADQESQRNRENAALDAQDTAGKKQLGSTLGSLAGMSVGGPWGALLGGAVGTIAGGLFSLVMAVSLVVSLALPSTSEAATHKQNAENRGARAGAASGFRGVSWSGGKWCATITHFGESKVLGRFDNVEDAKAARLKAEAELFTHSERP